MYQRSIVDQEERANHNDLFDSQQRPVWIDWFNIFWRAISDERWTYGPFRLNVESTIIKMFSLHLGMKVLISCIRFREILLWLFDLPIQEMPWSFLMPVLIDLVTWRKRKSVGSLSNFTILDIPILSLDCLSSSSSWYRIVKIRKLDSTRTWHAQKNFKALYRSG